MSMTLPFLGDEVTQQSATGGGLRGGQGLASQADSFAQALDRADQNPGQTAVSEVSGSADAQARARQALELGVPPEASRLETGDAILGGLQKLRSSVDASYERFSNISNRNLGAVETVVEMQREVIHYSLLLDVTSKLIGKSAQAVDQLMKGQ